MTKVAAIQMVSTPVVTENIETARRLIDEAAGKGADLVLLPEYWPSIGHSDAERLQHAEVYGRRYGTPKEPVIQKLEQGIDVILEIDIQGALKVKENYPDGVFIFILPPSMAELRKRLTGRGTETAEAIEMRLGETLKELSFIEKYDYCVVNGELDEAVSRVKSIVIAEHSKVTITAEELVKRYKEEE